MCSTISQTLCKYPQFSRLFVVFEVMWSYSCQSFIANSTSLNNVGTLRSAFILTIHLCLKKLILPVISSLHWTQSLWKSCVSMSSISQLLTCLILFVVQIFSAISALYECL